MKSDDDPISEWPVLNLGQVTESIFSGGTPSTATSSFWNGGIPWLSSGETRNRFIFSTEKTITEEGVAGSSTRFAQKSDTVIASAGQGITRGQVSYLEIDTYINQSVIVVRADQAMIDPIWLFYDLSSRYAELRRLSDSHSSRGSLTADLLKGLSLRVPPKRWQRESVEILYGIDQKIELNRRTNETLEDIARAMFKSWFVDFDPVRAKMNGEPSASICQRLGLTPDLFALFPDRLVDSELGEIPEGWEATKVEVATSKIFSGGTPDTRKAEYWGGELNWCSSGETRNRFVIETEKKITQSGVDNSSTKAVVPGDILIASAGQGHTRGQTSYCAIDTFINQSVVSVRANTKNSSPLWLFYNLASRYEEMRGLSDSHNSRGSLTTKLLGGMSLILPPFNLVKAFDDITGPLAHKQIEGAQQSVTLSLIRDALLPKLLSGELRVSIVEEAVV